MLILADTIVTSFPAKMKSDLDRAKENSSKDRYKAMDSSSVNDFIDGDELYDSTDIWRSVFRELRQNTDYGKRSQKTPLDLAWTIADQARAVFHKRNLDPHLQFIDMFEMEINEIVSPC
jgi:hypothetical protein